MRWFNWIASAIKKPLNKFFFLTIHTNAMNKIDNLKKYIVKDKLKLDCGKEISNFPLAYETFGKLNEGKIMVF